MTTSRQITAAEVQHQKRVKARKRDRVCEIKKAPAYRERERERARSMFHDEIRLCNF